MRILRALVVLLGVLLILAGDSPAESPAPPDDSSSDAEVLAQGNTEFALQLHRLLAAEGGNSVVSPLSVSMASAMLYAGARGSTQAEIASALNFELPPSELHTSFWRLRRDLQSRVARWAELSLANGLWIDDECSIVPEYAEVLSERYGAVAREIDLAGAAGKACGQINEWVSEQTNGRLGPVVTPAMFEPRTRAVLLNAVYFLGAWDHAFPRKNTKEEPFYLLDGGTVQASMMHRMGRHPYYENDSVQVLELEYQGSGLSMLIILPDEDSGLAEVEASLTPEVLDDWVGSIKAHQVGIALPRFEVGRRIDLIPLLGELGMTSAFRWGEADLTGVCADPDLYVNHAQQHVTLGITEEGTEAAAATVYVMTLGAGEWVRETHKQFIADRPFLYILRDMQRGTILFMGRLVDPTLEGSE